MNRDEKIDYTSYLRDKPQETDPAKLAAMRKALVKALRARGVHGHVSAVYYADWRVKVSLDGQYYGMFNAMAKMFFSGYPGD